MKKTTKCKFGISLSTVRRIELFWDNIHFNSEISALPNFFQIDMIDEFTENNPFSANSFMMSMWKKLGSALLSESEVWHANVISEYHFFFHFSHSKKVTVELLRTGMRSKISVAVQKIKLKMLCWKPFLWENTNMNYRPVYILWLVSLKTFLLFTIKWKEIWSKYPLL